MSEWAEELGLNAEGFDLGAAAAAELASRLHAGRVSILAGLDPSCVTTPPCPAAAASDAVRQAFEVGFRCTLKLAILAADNTPPGTRFLHLPSLAGGLCLFDAIRAAAGGSAEEGRKRVVVALCGAWGEACPAGLLLAGHAGRTVGHALAEEHGVAFAGPEAYAAYMATTDDKGALPQATAVEVERAASLEGRAVCSTTRVAEDGGVALQGLHLPADGVLRGDVVFVLHGMLGMGGEHFDALLPMEEAEGGPPELADEEDRDGAGGRVGGLDVVRVSAAAWRTARNLAVGASIAGLWRAGALRLAAAAVRGGEAGLVAACREAVREAGAPQADRPRGPRGRERAGLRPAEKGPEGGAGGGTPNKPRPPTR